MAGKEIILEMKEFETVRLRIKIKWFEKITFSSSNELPFVVKLIKTVLDDDKFDPVLFELL